MNSFPRRLVIVVLGGLLCAGLAQADDYSAHSPPLMAAASYPGRTLNVPDNGAIRRANPNSRQGTQSIAPRVGGVGSGAIQTRPPTLENGGIGNGYPTRQAPARPSGDAERRSN